MSYCIVEFIKNPFGEKAKLLGHPTSYHREEDAINEANRMRQLALFMGANIRFQVFPSLADAKQAMETSNQQCVNNYRPPADMHEEDQKVLTHLFKTMMFNNVVPNNPM